MFFACLCIRRPRRLRHLRRLAAIAPTAPLTITRFPSDHTPQRQNTLPRLPDGFPRTGTLCPITVFTGPVAVDEAESRVRAWLHRDQYGRTDTVTSAGAQARR